MTEATRPVPMQASRKRYNDRVARRLTAAVGAMAFALAGVIISLAAGTPKSSTATIIGEPLPNADQALVKAVGDYEAALAGQNSPAAAPRPSPSHLTSAPAPSRAQPAARPPAVVVSGGS